MLPNKALMMLGFVPQPNLHQFYFLALTQAYCLIPHPQPLPDALGRGDKA
ncbi:hypothetical protein GXM_05743 [Nostoc sphaeroides CCNUC1]|uniref:Uncharacterized protein n=1 Tax=Nostoc sphaeroides CCNUC1 TaxID=2653204 RepID=A0A5P8W6W4_9NOSO|nr:hypothetical protein GXM_05743 [Nostoc sphaeroides CCNUC1]